MHHIESRGHSFSFDAESEGSMIEYADHMSRCVCLE